jgi:hypothetical protein
MVNVVTASGFESSKSLTVIAPVTEEDDSSKDKSPSGLKTCRSMTEGNGDGIYLPVAVDTGVANEDIEVR